MSKTHEVLREDDGKSFKIGERKAVPIVAVGRFALPKNGFRAARHPLTLFQSELATLNTGKGTAVEPQALFLPYITPEEMAGMVEKKFGRERRGPRRAAYELRAAKRTISDALRNAQQAEGDFQCAMLETVVHDMQELEPDEEVIITTEDDDPGPYTLWGTVELQFRSQPALIDDNVLGIKPYVDDELADGYEKLKRVIQSDTPFDASFMDVNAWEPAIPVLHTFEPLQPDLKNAPRIPRPPLRAVLQEIKVSEL